jgi:hypothetical protein
MMHVLMEYHTTKSTLFLSFCEKGKAKLCTDQLDKLLWIAWSLVVILWRTVEHCISFGVSISTFIKEPLVEKRLSSQAPGANVTVLNQTVINGGIVPGS